METSEHNPHPETTVVESLADGEALAARRAAIVAAMQLSQTPAERAALKDDIVSLFRDVDAAMKGLLRVQGIGQSARDAVEGRRPFIAGRDCAWHAARGSSGRQHVCGEGLVDDFHERRRGG